MNWKVSRWATGVAASAALTIGLVPFPMVAQADTAPPDAGTPATVSADALPTAQIDGVAWTQLIIGNTVYVGGSFSTARPAGAAAGVNTTPRANLMAYDLTTGDLISSWAPSTNGDVLSIVASPDQSRLYIGGSFTRVNGQIRNRIAAVDRSTGNLIGSFQPKSDATVRAIAASADTVYFGGVTTSVNGVARNRLAAARAADGGLLSWAPNAQGGSVRAMALSPDNRTVLVGGSFTTMNGSGNPGYGLAAIDAATGASQPWAANARVRNGGANAAITSITSGGTNVYATGYVFGGGGNLEGIAKMSWATGELVWVEDCHGDTYQSAPLSDVVYSSSHAHYCGNIPGGFPETTPRTFHFGTAYTQSVEGTALADPLGYPNWGGTPTPALLAWDPAMTTGSYTGQSQASWSVVGNDTYVAYGGEFPTAGGRSQQGLVRFAVRAAAPNTTGPVVTGSRFNPTLVSRAPGEVRIGWQANWDRDNTSLTYQVMRSNTAAPINEVTQRSSMWNRPMMGFVDTGLTPGESYSYRIFAKDPLGNEVRSDSVSIVAAAEPADLSPYAQAVLADDPGSYWRLGETSGSTVYDWSGFNDTSAGSGVSQGAQGAITNDTDSAATFNGSTTGLIVSPASVDGPNSYSTEVWINTTTTRGGKIVGFGDATSGNSGRNDRHVYMTNTGQLVFGAYDGAQRTVTSPKSYNDGAWHHVVATLGSGGMVLYVDGAAVGSRTATTVGQRYRGYWRVGGDTLTGWPSQPTSSYFAGAVDEVAIYPRPLTASQVAAHYTRATEAGAPANANPKAAFTATVDGLAVSFDASGSTDADGTIATYAWDFGDGASGTGVASSHTYAAAGTYTATLIVTDNDGAEARASQSVTPVADAPPPPPPAEGPVAADAFGRTVSNGWGNADTGGTWSRYGSASLFSVAGGLGQIRLATPGSAPRMTLPDVAETATDVTVTASLDKVANGGGAYVSVAGRVIANDAYRAKLKVAASGATTLYLVRVTNNAESTLLQTNLGSAMNYTAGTTLRVRLQVTGTSPTTVRAKVWKTTATEPAGWTLTATDSTAALQAPGGIALLGYLSGSATNAPVVIRFDDLEVVTP